MVENIHENSGEDVIGGIYNNEAFIEISLHLSRNKGSFYNVTSDVSYSIH